MEWMNDARVWIAAGFGGGLLLMAWPFVRDFLIAKAIKAFEKGVDKVLAVGDEHVDRWIVHGLKVLEAEIPENLDNSRKIELMTSKVLLYAPKLAKHRERIADFLRRFVLAINEKSKNLHGFKVTLWDDQARTIIERDHSAPPA